MKNKKKSNKKKIIMGVIAVVLVAAVAGGAFSFRGQVANQFSEATAKKGTIETYYTFVGSVESKDMQVVMAEKIMQISEIKVSEGEKVKKDDILFKTSDGTKVKAKIDGTVSKLYVEEDQQVMAGFNLCDIYDFEDLLVTVKVDEYDLSCITIDKKIDVTIGALDKTITGTVSKISDTAINQNGVAYFTATIDLEKDSVIKVGMTAEARILNKQAIDVITLPLETIQFDEEDKPYIYVMDEEKDKNNIPIQKFIEIGINDGKTVEIIKGLSDNQIILYTKTVSSDEDGRFMPPTARE